LDRHGLQNDSRVKALALAMMQAIPTTRGKDRKYLRPEMTTLDALRLLFWEDLPAPPEEKLPELPTQLDLFARPADDGEEGGEADEDFDEEAEDDEDSEE
jgi:hypothetical protein